MRAKLKLYKELEMIPDAMWESALRKSKRNQLNPRLLLTKIWNVIVNVLKRNYEPQIWERRDRDNYTWWEVYDPVTGKTSCFSSRAEVLAWLERRYYRELL